MTKWVFTVKCCTAMLFLSTLALGQDSTVLVLKTRIPLPNINGRMDHFSVDLKEQRFFVSALGNNTVEVIDMQSCRVRTITGLSAPQGLLYDASTNRIAA